MRQDEIAHCLLAAFSGYKLLGGNFGDTAAQMAAKAIIAKFGWQPIETAPRDGTTIDLWVSGELPARYENCYFGKPHHECHSQYCDSCPEDLNVNAWRWHFFSQRLTPSHWMPTPTGPEQNNPPRGPSKSKDPASPDVGGGPNSSVMGTLLPVDPYLQTR